MDVRSLAFRTDLALLQLGGSAIEDHGSHLVVTTAANPSFYWGNFLLLAAAPAPGLVEHWRSVAARAFPGARHVALGVDGVDGSVADLAPLAGAGFEVDADAVMTAGSVCEPPRPDREAAYRPLRGDDDWEQQLSLALAGEDAHVIGEFARRKEATHRALTEAGHGAWFGAFLADRLVSSMGLLRAGDDGLARFQNVKTHPDARGRGIAGTLVHRVARHGFDELGARTLVMVADPGYPAIRIYRSVGFEETETQLGALLAPGAG